MDSLERAQALYDLNPSLPDKEGSSVGAGSPTLQPTNPYLRTSVPATLTQAPDSQRQFTVPGAGQQRFFNSIPLTANQSGAPAQSQAQTFARSTSAALTLNDIADTSDYRKVPIEQFDSNGNLIVVNFQGPWNSSTTYTDGQEVSYSGNVWVATSTNTNSTPAAGNPYWELVGPQTLDNVANGSTYGKVNNGALSGAGSIDLAGSAWVNKSLDHLPDGSTYARVVGSALSSGSIDLGAGAGWVNKNVDNVSDGSTFGRTLNTVLQSNTIRSPHASTIAQIAPQHWWPFEALSGLPALSDFGTGGLSLSPYNISGSGTYVLSNYSLVNGDALLAGTLDNYCAYINDSIGYPDFTISCWAYFNGANPPALAPLVSMTNFSPAGGTPSIAEPGLYVGTGGKATFQVYLGGVLTTLQSAAILNWTVPHHIVGVVSGNSMYLFVDGVLNTAVAGPGVHPALNYIVLGSYYNGSSWVWNSNTTLQHVSVWNSGLSTGQIAALYQAGATGAQSLDNLNDGYTWQRVTGVSGNKTGTSSYTPGSITASYTSVQSSALSIAAPSVGDYVILQVPLLSTASNIAALSAYLQTRLSSGSVNITLKLWLGGPTASPGAVFSGGTLIQQYFLGINSTSQTFTLPTTYVGGSLASQNITFTFGPQTAIGTTLYADNAALTIGNFKA